MSASFSFFRQTEQIELLFYAIFGLLIALTPLMMRLGFSFKKTSEKEKLKGNLTTEFLQRYGFYLSFPLAAMVFTNLVHFRWANDIGFISLSAVVTSLGIWIFSIGHHKNAKNKVILWTLIIFFSVIAAALNFSTSFFEQWGVNLNNHFHHWGAFISAAKSLDAGLAIFKDFPTQYGLGPTLLIALASRFFGWVSGMFYAVGLLQFCYWVSLNIIAFKLIENIKSGKYLSYSLLLLMNTLSCYFWIPDPAQLYSNQTPSLGGARYFPATFFVAILLSLDLYPQSFSKNKVWVMHAMWSVCALWSIESAFYASLIWWPYYAYIGLSANSSLRSKFRSIYQSIVELLLLAVALIISFLVIYWLIYRTLPELAVFTAFVDNVPGPLLIDFTGRFIFAASVFFISLNTLIFLYQKYNDSKEFHNLFVTTLLAYAAFSYYIGRSADYNILPIIPFFSLMLLSMCPLVFPRFIRFFSITLLSLMMCWAGVNQYNKDFSRLYLFDFNGKTLDAKFQKYREDPLMSNLGRAIAYISKNYNESAIVIDPAHTITVSGNQVQWNSYNNIATYEYLPVEMQKKFIEQSKKKLMKAGWILVHKDMEISFNSYILDLFSNAYNHNEALIFGDYKAFRFTPKQN